MWNTTVSVSRDWLKWQVVPEGDVEQVVRRQRAIGRRLQMVGRDEVLLGGRCAWTNTALSGS